MTSQEENKLSINPAKQETDAQYFTVDYMGKLCFAINFQSDQL